MEKKTYNLLTFITMIVGIVVGSGIYFRADDILAYTNNNLVIGLMVLVLGAISIVFGSLTLSRLTIRANNQSGGLVSYYQEFISEKVASGFAWFQCFVYFPSICIVISYASAIYTFLLFGYDATLFHQIFLGFIYFTFFLIVNTLNKKIGGWFQNIATAIKLLPLIVIGLYGIFFSPTLSIETIGLNSFSQEFSGFSWLSALIPLTFSYDGWVIALNIIPELKDSQHKASLGLILSPLFILLVYVIYIVGLVSLLGVDQVSALGDQSVYVAVSNLLGQRMGNVMLVIIVISVLGVINGCSLGFLRLPSALEEKGYLPNLGLNKIKAGLDIPIRSAFLCFGLVSFWAICHFVVIQFNLFNGRDVSEISIVFSYVIYILLYLKVFSLENRTFKIISLLAILGSLVILIGSLITSFGYVSLFMVLCFGVFILGYLFQTKKVELKH